jgi:hypothetical protein
LIFFKKVDIVKRLISILVFNIQPGTDSPGLNVFSAGCRRSQYTQRLTVEYPDDFHIVHDKPALFRNNLNLAPTAENFSESPVYCMFRA